MPLNMSNREMDAGWEELFDDEDADAELPDADGSPFLFQVSSEKKKS